MFAVECLDQININFFHLNGFVILFHQLKGLEYMNEKFDDLFEYNLTDAISKTGASGVPSKSHKSFICGGVRQTITLKSPGKEAPPSTPYWGLQWLPLFWMQYIKPSLPSRIGFFIFSSN